MQSRKVRLLTPLRADLIKELVEYFVETKFLSARFTVKSDCIFDERFKKVVLGFGAKTEAGFSEISSDYSPEKLAAFFTILPPDLSKPLFATLKGSDLLPKEEKVEDKEQMTAQTAKTAYEETSKTKGPLKGTIPINFEPSKAIAVLQHEYAITTAIDEHPILGSYGAEPCAILALYEATTKTAALAHIDTNTTIDSLLLLLKCFSKNPVAHLVGGDEEQPLLRDIRLFLHKHNIQIVNDDTASSSLAIDARTGHIYSPVHPRHFQAVGDEETRMAQIDEFLTEPLVQYYPKPAPQLTPLTASHPSSFLRELGETNKTINEDQQQTPKHTHH